MVSSVTQLFWRALRQAMGRISRAGAVGLLLGVALVETLALVFNHRVGAPADLAWAWPPIVSLAPLTLFVHVLAGIVGVLLSLLLALAVAVAQTIRGVVFATEHVDEVAGAVVERGLDLADAAVDALDGPNRHGFRGKRDPSVVQ